MCTIPKLLLFDFSCFASRLLRLLSSKCILYGEAKAPTTKEKQQKVLRWTHETHTQSRKLIAFCTNECNSQKTNGEKKIKENKTTPIWTNFTYFPYQNEIGTCQSGVSWDPLRFRRSIDICFTACRFRDNRNCLFLSIYEQKILPDLNSVDVTVIESVWRSGKIRGSRRAHK